MLRQPRISRRSRDDFQRPDVRGLDHFQLRPGHGIVVPSPRSIGKTLGNVVEAERHPVAKRMNLLRFGARAGWSRKAKLDFSGRGQTSGAIGQFDLEVIAHS